MGDFSARPAQHLPPDGDPAISIMNVKSFVAASACLLAAWLTFTFVREVPRDGYQRLGKGSKPLTSAAAPASAEDSAPGQLAPAIVASRD
jgi:hypothetical protein